MSFTEKVCWVIALVVPLAYAAYVFGLLGKAPQGTALSDLPYVGAMIKTWIITVVAIVVATIAISVASPDEAGVSDERDRSIYRTGEYVGLYLVVLAGMAAMIMAMAELDYFWIANILNLGFVLSALVGAIVQIFGYRRGLPRW